MTHIEFGLDGESVTVDARPTLPLRDLLRQSFDKTCVKVGCQSGRCGACTVLLDGEPVKSCLVMAAKADGRDVRTVEGIDRRELDVIESSFKGKFAAQCGYCTPGFAVTTASLLTDDGDGPEDVESALEGHVCRCTGYRSIVDAVESLSRE